MDLEQAKSYLQARDPSIISYNIPKIKKVKMNLADLMGSTSTTESGTEDKSDESKFINVYLRIRADIKIDETYKIDDNTFTCKVPEGSHALRNVKVGNCMKKSYIFTKIFGPDVDQKTIFEFIVKPKLVSFINGRNSTLFTYGASGSGKTYTIVGTPDEPGLIPRALEYVFKSVPNMSLQPEVEPLPNGTTKNMSDSMLASHEKYKNIIINATLYDQASHIRTYKQMQNRLSSEPIAEVGGSSDVSVSAWISFTEIYNENIYDLLSLTDTKNKIRQRLALGKSKDESTYIKKLNYLPVTNGLEAYQILQYGLHNLNYAATAVNSHSSRSHCIFTIRLVQSSTKNRDVYISNFHFCDLAGAERLKKTMNCGDRLKESNNINTSLLVLGRCMDNIKRCQQIKDSRLIPFRESKLTQIFQKALMGYENVEMIVNVNPSREMFDETIHVLNFSAVAQTIILEEVLPKPVERENRFSMMMQKEEKSKETKTTVSNIDERRDFEELRNKLYEAQKDNRRLLREVERLKEELEENRDPNDEIRNLNDAMDLIIEERDKLIETYEKKIIEEKEAVATKYKEMIDRFAEMYKENQERALKRQRLKYEEKISELQSITISSDDEESPKKSDKKDLEEKILYYKNLNAELSENLRKTQEKLDDCESLIEDAKKEYRYSQMEIKRISEENNELKSDVVTLHEEIDKLKLQLMYQSMNYFHENSSDTESQGSTQNGE